MPSTYSLAGCPGLDSCNFDHYKSVTDMTQVSSVLKQPVFPIIPAPMPPNHVYFCLLMDYDYSCACMIPNVSSCHKWVTKQDQIIQYIGHIGAVIMKSEQTFLQNLLPCVLNMHKVLYYHHTRFDNSKFICSLLQCTPAKPT